MVVPLVLAAISDAIEAGSSSSSSPVRSSIARVGHAARSAAAAAGATGGGEFLVKTPRSMPPANVSWSIRGAWLLQERMRICDPVQERCDTEATQVLVLLISLCSTIIIVICAFTFFREDKEEQITPLCPQLVVKDADLRFEMPLQSEAEIMEVTGRKSEAICKVSMDWPDPFRPGASGVAATVRLQNPGAGTTLATVVARNVAVSGQGLALCRSGCEIFGFVEPDTERRYHVRHRTGVHLLTLFGDFDSINIEGINPVGSKVCSIQKSNDGIVYGRVLQHVDAGLVICALLATHVHRRLSHPVPVQTYGSALDPAFGYGRPVPSGPSIRDGPPGTIVNRPATTEGEAPPDATPGASPSSTPSVPPTPEVPVGPSGQQESPEQTPRPLPVDLEGQLNQLTQPVAPDTAADSAEAASLLGTAPATRVAPPGGQAEFPPAAG